jgi:molybdate transport system substrate-binding protein
VLLVALAVSAGAGLGAQTLTVAAASDLQAALPAISSQFERDTGAKVTVTFGSSGNLFAQIRNGAPFDVFLAADVDYPRSLEQDGLAERGSVRAYATGRLVLWTRNDSGIDLRRGLRVVAEDAVRRIALANPEHAPYGRAAVAALRHEGLYESARRKFALGENISQAAQFAQSGNADVGLLALSLALSPALKRAGRYVDVPETFHPPITQAAAVLAASRQKPLARQFVEALEKPEAMRVLQSYGFAPAQAKVR